MRKKKRPGNEESWIRVREAQKKEPLLKEADMGG